MTTSAAEKPGNLKKVHKDIVLKIVLNVAKPVLV